MAQDRLNLLLLHDLAAQNLMMILPIQRRPRKIQLFGDAINPMKNPHPEIHGLIFSGNLLFGLLVWAQKTRILKRSGPEHLLCAQ